MSTWVSLRERRNGEWDTCLLSHQRRCSSSFGSLRKTDTVIEDFFLKKKKMDGKWTISDNCIIHYHDGNTVQKKVMRDVKPGKVINRIDVSISHCKISMNDK